MYVVDLPLSELLRCRFQISIRGCLIRDPTRELSERICLRLSDQGSHQRTQREDLSEV
jgi:hypothetical protein